MEKLEVQIHKHPLIPFTRFDFSRCEECRPYFRGYIYGGYRCNELGCGAVFHEECAKHAPEINHHFHPDHPLKLVVIKDWKKLCCSLCSGEFKVGYLCSICDFKMDLYCARRPVIPLVIPENSYRHKHPLQLSREKLRRKCKACTRYLTGESGLYYRCEECEFAIHMECVHVFPEAYHTSHPQHPLKHLSWGVPYYADKECLLCGKDFFEGFGFRAHHCDVCNFTICGGCTMNPPPLAVVSSTTHQHQLHLFPRRIKFTCNACGTLGEQSPYFCLGCNFMIHWECIDLPRVININYHDHRISYTRRLGLGKQKCRVCRKEVDKFHGAYSCSKCSDCVVHSRCATSKQVWDLVELEGTPEEEEIPPFEVIGDEIKHCSHDHNLEISKDGMILPESTLCGACVLQIISEPFYSCKQCDFILHEKCAKLPRKKRHVCDNLPFTLQTDPGHNYCRLCDTNFSGFRYISGSDMVVDVRCYSMTDSIMHDSHPHRLHYTTNGIRRCSHCENYGARFSCDKCEYKLCFKCASLPQKVMRHRHDDHPLFLSYGGESIVHERYWCEACESEVDPKKWFYTCKDCGVILHVSCVVGDFSYKMPVTGTNGIDGLYRIGREPMFTSRWDIVQVVSNTSACRPLCSCCNFRCKLPSVLKVSNDDVVFYVCSYECFESFSRHYFKSRGVRGEAIRATK